MNFPSKDYFKARGGEGRRFCYMLLRIFLGGIGYFMKKLRNVRYALENSKKNYLLSLMRCSIIHRSSVYAILCQECFFQFYNLKDRSRSTINVKF